MLILSIHVMLNVHIKSLLFCIIFLFTLTSYAESTDNKIINKFKAYLNEIKSIAVDFTQTDSSGTIVNGKLLINKPYRFRCNYYPPHPLVIVGNKNYVSVFDYEMSQLSNIKAEENVFSFLLTDSEFDKHFRIISAEENDIYVIVKLYHDLSERSSQITFDKSTNQIHSLDIFEDHNTINITFDSIAKVKNFNADLFYIKNSDIFGPPERLDKISIEKKYTIAHN